MNTLRSQLLTSPLRRRQLIEECGVIVRDEAKDIPGLKGKIIQGALKAASKVLPRGVEDILDNLIDSFVDQLEPNYFAHRNAGGDALSFCKTLSGNIDSTAEVLLGVCDDKIEARAARSLKPIYSRLRPGAKPYVVKGLPRILSVVERHLRESE